MPTSLTRLNRPSRRLYRPMIAAVLVAYGTCMLLAFALLFSNPKFASWVSEAAQAEMVGAYSPRAPEPVRLVAPTGPIRTVDVD
jgi:hypothetical protein